MDEQEVIEVEAVEKEVPAPKAKKPKKPQKAKYQYGGRIAFFTKLDFFCLRVFFPLFFCGMLGCLFFGIPFSEQPDNTLFLVLLIISACLLGLSLLDFVLHFVWRRLIKHWMSLDPNYQ